MRAGSMVSRYKVKHFLVLPCRGSAIHREKNPTLNRYCVHGCANTNTFSAIMIFYKKKYGCQIAIVEGLDCLW